MTKYKVRVYRHESKAVNVYVEADDIEKARKLAEDKAANIDFNDEGKFVSSSYEIVETREIA